jgi:hypothetical protein
MIIGFVVKVLSAPTYSDCNAVLADGHRINSDLNGDCYVDYLDLEIIAYYWLHTDCVTPGNCQNADFTPIDGTVDFFDAVQRPRKSGLHPQLVSQNTDYDYNNSEGLRSRSGSFQPFLSSICHKINTHRNLRLPALS